MDMNDRATQALADSTTAISYGIVKLSGTKAHGAFAIIDADDVERVSKFTWNLHLTGPNRYARRAGPGCVLMHDFILGTKGVDHADGNGLNNRRSNLRTATQSQNLANRQKQQGVTSRYKGVHWYARSGSWRASVTKDYQRYNLGAFTEEEEAARAYDTKARELFGEFAVLNFPEETT